MNSYIFYKLPNSSSSSCINFYPIDSFTRDILDDLRCKQAVFTEQSVQDMKTIDELFFYVMVEYKIHLPIHISIKYFRIKTLECDEYITQYTEITNTDISDNDKVFYQFSGSFQFSMLHNSCSELVDHYNEQCKSQLLKQKAVRKVTELISKRNKHLLNLCNQVMKRMKTKKDKNY